MAKASVKGEISIVKWLGDKLFGFVAKSRQVEDGDIEKIETAAMPHHELQGALRRRPIFRRGAEEQVAVDGDPGILKIGQHSFR